MTAPETRTPAHPAIVCAVDDSPDAGRAVAAAAWLASALEAVVVIAHVFDPLAVFVPPAKTSTLGPSVDQLVDAARAQAQESLAAAAELLEGIEHARVFAEGDPAKELPRIIGDHDARLAITASSSPSRLDLVLGGGTTAGLVGTSPCPVVAVPEDAALGEPGPVLAAYDGSNHSLRAARHGAALAARMGRGLVLLHVTEHGREPVLADDALANELAAAAERALWGVTPDRALDLDVSIVHDEGGAAATISRIARDCRAALIVVGTRGMNPAAAALIGSVSVGLVQSAGRPVVLASPAAG